VAEHSRILSATANARAVSGDEKTPEPSGQVALGFVVFMSAHISIALYRREPTLFGCSEIPFSSLHHALVFLFR
jgi:hypothetical protein